MKIVVIGDTGLIGSKTVAILRQGGTRSSPRHPKAASIPSPEGLKEALASAQVVIDLSNTPSFDPKGALEFFETLGETILSRDSTRASRQV